MDEYCLNDLMIAVNHEYDIEKTIKIISSGINVNSPNKAGCTPLMFAVMPNDYGDHNAPEAILKMVKLLLNHNADIEVVDSFGKKAKDYTMSLLDPEWKDYFGSSVASAWSPDDRKIIENIIQLL